MQCPRADENQLSFLDQDLQASTFDMDFLQTDSGHRDLLFRCFDEAVSHCTHGINFDPLLVQIGNVGTAGLCKDIDVFLQSSQ